MSSLFNTLSRFLIAFLPRSKHLLISWLQSSFNFMHLQWFWNTRKESLSLFPLFPHLFDMKWCGWMPWSSFFECWVLSQLFHSPLSLSSRGSLVIHFLPEGWYYLHIWSYWYFSQSWFQLVLLPVQCFSWCTLHRSYISRVTIYSLDILRSQFGTSLLFHVQF